MAFYVDYRFKPTTNHVVILCFTYAYLEYGTYGYQRTVDYASITWC